jgi:hypothetical protein
LRRLASGLLTPLEKFYPTAKALYMWRKGRDYRKYRNGPILILQMGKVGSKSMKAGLAARINDRPMYHSHFLSRERNKRTEKKRRKFFRSERYTYLMRPWQNQFLLKTYEDRVDDFTWTIVTLTREPIGRNISAFFSNLTVEHGESEGDYIISSDRYGIEPTTVTVDDVDKLSELFFARATHDTSLHFFNREIRDIFGIDVIGSGFDIAKGYQVYRGDRAELLVIRLEDLADCAASAFKEYLGLEDFHLVNKNVGAKKMYAPLYDAFKKQVSIPPGYVDRLLNSEYMRTFYTDEEIRGAREKWLRSI